MLAKDGMDHKAPEFMRCDGIVTHATGVIFGTQPMPIISQCALIAEASKTSVSES